MNVAEQSQFSNSTIDCRQSLYQAGASLQRHYHDSTWVVLACSGSFSLTIRSRETMFRPRRLFYLPAGEMHANVFGSQGAGIFITAVDPGWIGNRLEVANADADCPRVAPPGYLRRLALKMYEEFKRPYALSALIVECACLQLLGRALAPGL